MTLSRETIAGDLVLIQSDGNPAGFARVEAIRPHELEGWYHCDLLLLAVPPRPITWILERAQIDGADFTMSGQPIRLERLPEIGALHADAAASEPVVDEEETASDRSDDAGAAREAREQSASDDEDSGQRSGKVVDLFPRD